MKIIISVALTFFLLGCSDEESTASAKQDIFKQESHKVETVINSTKEVNDSAPEVEQPIVETVENIQVLVGKTTEVTEVKLTPKGAVELFKVCSSCHGLNGEKKALNKSQVIQGWSEVQVTTALKGYKDGSYGGAMKGLMKSQVTKLSDEDIATLSKHISGL